MFIVSKKFDMSCAHQLQLPYESPCNRQHGHNYGVEVVISGSELAEHGTLVDFSLIKRTIHGTLDHHDLNLVMDTPHTTAENIAAWIAKRLQDRIDELAAKDQVPNAPIVQKVVVKESEGNTAIWIRNPNPNGYL